MVYASVNRDSAEDVGGSRFYVIPDANRWSKMKLFHTAIRILLLMLKIRPAIIISTGAAPGFFALFWGKKLGAKTIWIDSIANASELSMSGKLAGKHADLWLTQWKDLAEPGGPEYHGSII